MRRIIAFDNLSADGYFSGPDGGLDWVVPEPQLDKEVAKGLGKPSGNGHRGTMLFGRKTYEMFEKFWPKALDDSDTSPDPHADGRRSRDIRAMAVWINEADKVVFSRSRKDVSWRNSRVLPELDPREIEGMKKQKGHDILIFGSGSVVSQLTEKGLIDEYRFVVGPLLLGSGRDLVSGVPKSLKLALQEAKAYPSGNVMLRYARAS